MEINHINLDAKVIPHIDRNAIAARNVIKREEMKAFAIAFHARHLLALYEHDITATAQALKSLGLPYSERVTPHSPLTLGETIALVDRCGRVIAERRSPHHRLDALQRLYPDADMRDPLMILGCEAGVCPGQKATFREGFGKGPKVEAEVVYVGKHKGMPVFDYMDRAGMPRWAYFRDLIKAGERKGGA